MYVKVYKELNNDDTIEVGELNTVHLHDHKKKEKHVNPKDQ